MKSKDDKLKTGRRDALKTLGLGSAALFSGGIGNITSAQAASQGTLQKPPVGLPPIKIKSNPHERLDNPRNDKVVMEER